MKAFMLGGAHSGTGKTLMTLGILRALAARGLRAQPFKCGPDYIDTGWHQAVSGISSHNLDAYMLAPEILRGLFTRHMQAADIGVIEGVMGLYDGLGQDGECSSAALAKTLGVPVVLVIDGKGVSTSAAATVLGFQHFDSAVNIAGIIVNRVSSESHYSLIKTAITRYCRLPVLGYLPPLNDWQLPSRHLGLVPALENPRLDDQWRQLADSVERFIDLDALLSLVQCAPSAGTLPTPPQDARYRQLTLALAHDDAFHFYYPDNLQLLKDIGVRIVPFSPLKDTTLPDCQLIYLGGGFPEVFAERLAANAPMRAALLRAGRRGVAIYAECGGLMYLSDALENEQGQYPMVGLLRGISRMSAGLKRFGYCEARALTNTLLAEEGETLRGHEFHHSEFITDEPPLFTLTKSTAKRDNAWTGGYGGDNILASYLHVHFYQRPAMLRRWLSQGCALL